MPQDPSPYAARPWLAAYPPGVPHDFDFPQVPLTRLLDDAAASFPLRAALEFLGTTITYRELRESVDALAGSLAALGIGAGDRVAVVLPNCPQSVITTYAVLRLGGVVVQCNPLYTPAELRHQLTDSGAVAVVCLDRVQLVVEEARQGTAVRRVVVTSLVDYLPSLRRLGLLLPLPGARRARARLQTQVARGPDTSGFLSLVRAGGASARQAPVDPVRDAAVIQYTTGTTGTAKGAVLTHANLVANAYQNRLWLSEAKAGREVVLTVLPLFHVYGLTVCMNTGILLAATLVLLPRFDLDEVLAAMDEHRPTLFPGVPPIYKAIVDAPLSQQRDLRSVRACVSGAMALPLETQEAFERLTGGRLVEGYGLTETSPSTHANPVTGPRRPGIGLPLPGTTARIVDPEDPEREVPVGTPGELAVGGPQVFAGYWDGAARPADGALLTADGHLLTGDLAVMDDEGWFRVVDRKKDVIIAGGFNIAPTEVEDAVRTLPGVADVAVAGVPDRYRGETVKAFVVPAAGATLTVEDVVAHAARVLTPYKVPKLVEFRDELPRSAALGKVLRRVLVEEARAAAAASAEPLPASVPGGATRATVGRAPLDAGAPTAEVTEPGAAAPAAATVTAPAVEKAPVKKAPVKKAPVKKAPVKKAAPPTRTPAATASVATPPPPAVAAAQEPAHTRARPRTPGSAVGRLRGTPSPSPPATTDTAAAPPDHGTGPTLEP